MHSSTIIAALLAGSQIASSLLVLPSFYTRALTNERRTSHAPQQTGYSDLDRRAAGRIRKHRKGGKSNSADGYIGPHGGNGRRKGTGGSTSTSTLTSTVTIHPTITTTITDYVTATHAGHAGHRHNSQSQDRKKGHHKKPQPTGYGGGGDPITDGSYQDTVVQLHNVHRANHSASDLTWSSDLESIALEIANSCVFEHNLEPGGGGYGQNIAAGTPPSQVSKVISDQFYNNEMELFDGMYGDPNPTSNFEEWGHFSQLVWKGTMQVGCVTVHCPNGVAKAGSNVAPYYTVCNYKPPGNVANGYAKNVGEPLGNPVVSG